MTFDIVDSLLGFFQYGISRGHSNEISLKIRCYRIHTHKASLQYGFSSVLSKHYHKADANGLWPGIALYGLSPLWVRKCLLKAQAARYVLWHNSHLYGLSPVWVAKCLFKLSSNQNDLWHNKHLCGIAPV